MTEVKICGLRRSEDIEYVNKYLPEYAGFVFSNSRRRVDIEKAVILAKNLAGGVKKVGVFADEKTDFVKLVAYEVGLDVIQFHGLEDDFYMEDFKEFELWKAFEVKDKLYSKQIKFRNADGILFDSGKGGSGKAFDWNFIKNLRTDKKVILAGGICMDNVERALAMINPDVLDVSSGVETSGVKDQEKIKKLIQKVRERN